MDGATSDGYVSASPSPLPVPVIEPTNLTSLESSFSDTLSLDCSSDSDFDRRCAAAPVLLSALCSPSTCDHASDEDVKWISIKVDKGPRLGGNEPDEFMCNYCATRLSSK